MGLAASMAECDTALAATSRCFLEGRQWSIVAQIEVAIPLSIRRDLPKQRPRAGILMFAG